MVLAMLVVDSKSVTWSLNGAVVGTNLFIVDLAILKMFWYFLQKKKVLVAEEESLANLGPGTSQTGTMTVSVLYV